MIDAINNENETPIMLACKLKRQDFCNLLIDNKADLEIADKNGDTIYHYIGLYSLSNVNVDTIICKKNIFLFK